MPTHIPKDTVIYGITFESACKKLKNMIDNELSDGIAYGVKDTRRFGVTMKNGDTYHAIGCDNFNMWYRWDIAYIDKNMSDYMQIMAMKGFKMNDNASIADCIIKY